MENNLLVITDYAFNLFFGQVDSDINEKLLSEKSDHIPFSLQTAGLGGLKPNSILMGWPENWKTKNSYENFSRVVRSVEYIIKPSCKIDLGFIKHKPAHD